jgi:hypothetical protein
LNVAYCPYRTVCGRAIELAPQLVLPSGFSDSSTKGFAIPDEAGYQLDRERTFPFESDMEFTIVIATGAVCPVHIVEGGEVYVM